MIVTFEVNTNDLTPKQAEALVSLLLDEVVVRSTAGPGSDKPPVPPAFGGR